MVTCSTPASRTILLWSVAIFLTATSSNAIAKQPSTENAATPCWPAFLGQGASPISVDKVPLRWSHDQNVAWKADLAGGGQSSPVIWGDKVFVTSIEGTMKESCIVTALSLADGKKLWSHKTSASQPVRSNYFQSRSAPTPVADTNGIYAFFETGDIVALSHDGQELWTRSLVDDFGEFEIRIGLAASLAQTQDQVIVLIDHEGASYLLSINKSDGKDFWQTERFSRQSYSSPVMLKIAGKEQIVCSSDGSVDGYDPLTGEQLWTFEEVGGNRSTSPMPTQDGQFLIGASPGMHGEHSADARESNLLMSVSKNGESFEPKVVWQTKKAMPSFASPMVYQGRAYWVSNIGIVYCFDAETGKRLFAKRIGQRCWATPIGIGNRVYFVGKDGTTIVLEASDEFSVLAKNELLEGADEKGAADVKRREERERQNHHRSTDSANGKPDSPKSGNRDGASGQRPSSRDGETFAQAVQYGFAIVDGSFVIRTGSHVYCIRETSKAGDQDASN